MSIVLPSISSMAYRSIQRNEQLYLSNHGCQPQISTLDGSITVKGKAINPICCDTEIAVSPNLFVNSKAEAFVVEFVKNKISVNPIFFSKAS